jgi:hypothetical protein
MRNLSGVFAELVALIVAVGCQGASASARLGARHDGWVLDTMLRANTELSSVELGVSLVQALPAEGNVGRDVILAGESHEETDAGHRRHPCRHGWRRHRRLCAG